MYSTVYSVIKLNSFKEKTFKQNLIYLVSATFIGFCIGVH